MFVPCLELRVRPSDEQGSVFGVGWYNMKGRRIESIVHDIWNVVFKPDTFLFPNCINNISADSGSHQQNVGIIAGKLSTTRYPNPWEPNPPSHVSLPVKMSPTWSRNGGDMYHMFQLI